MDKIKVLWFEVTTPSRYNNQGVVIGGWQDSLEAIVREVPEIELYVAFPSRNKSAVVKKNGGVTYFPIKLEYTLLEKIKSKWTWDVYADKVCSSALEVVNKVNPDIIQCFGSEWLWGLVALRTTTPCVVHIQGSIVPYMNAQFPPGYNEYSVAEVLGLKKLVTIKKQRMVTQSWIKQETKLWKTVKYYMGRTNWDHSLTKMMNPNACYFHVNEALRDSFFSQEERWACPKNKTIKLFSTGCTTFWKGPDMMLKTARILKNNGIDFEWIVAGKMDVNLRKIVEHHEKCRFEDVNIKLIGFTEPNELIRYLCSSTMYVHTAYIENSPNSICEAQILGVPIVSTNVGGISTLLDGNGILVPANDPWQMANAILELANDKDKMKKISQEGMSIAGRRHSPSLIKEQLMNCYMSILGR